MRKNIKNSVAIVAFGSQRCIRLLTCCCAVLLAVTLMLSSIAVSTAIRSSRARLTSPGTPTIVLDAGHGGMDAGVIGKQTGVRESDLNLKYVRELQKMLQDAGYKVILTRDGSGGLYGIPGQWSKRRDMQKRREIISLTQPLLVISIHMNKYSAPSRSGAQVFFQKNDTESAQLASSVQTQLNRLSEREYKGLAGNFYVLQNDCPSIIVECGFLSNTAEELLLCTDAHRQAVCRAIFEGVILFLLR